MVLGTTNDVLMLWDGERSGLVGRGQNGVVGSTVVKLTPLGKTDAGFLFHALNRKFDWIQARRTGTGVPHVPKDLATYLRLRTPPRSEDQALVAEILDTVDEAIRGTEHLISKLELIRRGLLNDLLTRGIDEDGTLRDPTQHPKQFGDSLMGLIPRDWEVGRLCDVVDKIDAGWSPACAEHPPATEEWGVLKVSAVTSGTYLSTEAKTLPKALSPRSEIEVSPGDVILARANGVADLVGVTVEVLATPPRLMLSDKLLRLRPNGSRMRGSFLALMMQSAPVRKQIGQALSGSSGQKNISQDAILGLGVAVPQVDEQDRVIQVSRRLNNQMRCETVLLKKLRSLKLGLRDDLLTGRVSVTPNREGDAA